MESTTQSAPNSNIPIPVVTLSYDATEPLRVIQALVPNWGQGSAKVEIIRLTGGVNNTLYKARNKQPDLSKEELDDQSILIRIYGNSTEILVDRERELVCHILLQQHGLAPPIVGRFENGYAYGFVPGNVCSPTDLCREPVWRAVARRMAQWHAVLPVDSSVDEVSNTKTLEMSAHKVPTPNLWSVLQNWILALPASDRQGKARRGTFMTEAERLISDLGHIKLVFSHCDLLGGNIVIKPRVKGKGSSDQVEEVDFIDFEYAMPTPAAFDIACHFSEWIGFECDYNLLPTQSIRRAFLIEYMQAYNEHVLSAEDKINDLDALCKEVDSLRGLPGLFWGIAALLQASISKIDFDFKGYAELRIKEYWDWQAEEDGSRARSGKEIPPRERRWAQKE